MRALLHRFELRIAAIAAVALLIAQLGAMSHAYSHDAVVGKTATQQQSAAIHDLCGDCLAYAPLLAAAGASGALPSIVPPQHGLSTRATAGSLADLSPTLAFRSRAPPTTRQ